MPRRASLLISIPALLAFAPQPVLIKVSPSIMMVRSDVHVEVRVPPRAENRTLVVQWDSDAGDAGKEVEPLDGADAPVLHTWDVRDVPPADYTFEARVLDAAGKTLALDRAEIHAAIQ